MDATIRRYRQPEAVSQALIARQEDLALALGDIPGFVTWYAVPTANGDLLTVTVCRDRVSARAATGRATAWIHANLPGAGMAFAPVGEDPPAGNAA
jgi:hypothetical protein